jgi:hypothetical protein
MVARPQTDIITVKRDVNLITIKIPFINLRPKPSAILSISNRIGSELPRQCGENRPHGLSFSPFRTPWAGLIIPGVEVDMSVTNILCNESLQEQSGNNGAGKRFG